MVNKLYFVTTHGFINGREEMHMLGRSALGYQDYEEVITEDIFYIDKTGFINEWWEYGDKVTLITSPRRFGKTLNMSMIECFFPINMQEEANYLKEKTSGGMKRTDNCRGRFL